MKPIRSLPCSMKRLSALFFVVCLLLLSACHGRAAVQESDPPLPESTAPGESESPPPASELLPPASEPLPTDSGAPDTLPWDPPEEEEASSYEEYFAQIKTYDWTERSRGLSVNGYRLYREDSRLYMMDSHTDQVLWEIAELDDVVVFSGDDRWVYLVAGGTELIRMDYLGENRETLFTDETGLISRMNQSVYNSIPERVDDRSLDVMDGKVLYFWAGAEDRDGAALYRLYIPEKRADVVYQYSQEELDAYLLPDTGDEGGPFYRVSQPYPISNWEVGWYVGNCAFYEIYDAMTVEEFPFELPPDERLEWCVRTNGMTDAFAHYQNALTGEHKETNGGVTDVLNWGGIGMEELPLWWEEV